MKRVLVLVLTAACNNSGVVFDGRDGGVPAGACGLAAPAFCEQFETPSPGGRGGDLDETRFSFARWGHQVQYSWERIPAHTYTDGHLFPASFCGAPFSGLLPDADVRACAGTGVDGSVSQQLNEAFDDQGAFGLNSMRIRQPFDFAGRTGVVSWDVDGKINPLNLGHGWWFEVWITEDPSPLPHDHIDSVSSNPRRGVGFSFTDGADCPEDQTHWQNGISGIHVIDDYASVKDIAFFAIEELADRCFQVADAHLNHFELRLSQDRAEIWASDYDRPSTLKLRAAIPNLGLKFSRGYVHFQHGQFNAAQDGNVTPSQTFRWDNLGFDGPILPLPRAYDVPDNGSPGHGNAVLLGWSLAPSQSLTVHNVDLGGATSATLNFALNGGPNDTLTYRLNGNAPHTFTYPDRPNTTGGVHGFSAPVPLSDLVLGDNTIDFTITTTSTQPTDIGDIDLTVE